MSKTKRNHRQLQAALERVPDEAYWSAETKRLPDVRKRANAEWDAMDDFGNLPDGWEYVGC